MSKINKPFLLESLSVFNMKEAIAHMTCALPSAASMWVGPQSPARAAERRFKIRAGMWPSLSCEGLGGCTLGWGYQGRLLKWAKQSDNKRQRLHEGAVQTGERA